MWFYKDREVSNHNDLPPTCTDFVYMIEYTNGKKYIGKKTIKSLRTKPPLAGKKRKRRVWTELPFADYKGSYAEDFGYETRRKEILYLCSTKKAATYLEAALIFHHDALFDPDFLNRNIVGKFFPKDLDGLIEEE